MSQSKWQPGEDIFERFVRPGKFKVGDVVELQNNWTYEYPDVLRGYNENTLFLIDKRRGIYWTIKQIKTNNRQTHTTAVIEKFFKKSEEGTLLYGF